MGAEVQMLALIGIATLMVFVFTRKGSSNARRDEGMEAAESAATATYEALLARYQPAYRAASNLNGAAIAFIVFGIVALVWGLFPFGSSGLKQAIAPLLVGGGFFSVVTGFIMSRLAALLRAILDRTAFVAPELDDADRTRLAFEAGGEAGPIGRK